MKLRSEKGTAAATETEFRKYAQGLICLADGTQPFDKLIDIYGAGNVYAEIQRHLIRSEEIANQRVLELARQWKLAGDCHQRRALHASQEAAVDGRADLHSS